MQTTPPYEDSVVDIKPFEAKPVIKRRPFKASEIDQMNFQVKMEDDPVGENGLIQYERCQLCKFFIDKGNYYL